MSEEEISKEVPDEDDDAPIKESDFDIFSSFSIDDLVVSPVELNGMLREYFKSFNTLAFDLFKMMMETHIKNGYEPERMVEYRIKSSLKITKMMLLAMREEHVSSDIYEELFTHVASVKKKVYQGLEASEVIDMDRFTKIYLKDKLEEFIAEDEDDVHNPVGPCNCPVCREARGDITPDEDFGVSDDD